VGRGGVGGRTFLGEEEEEGVKYSRGDVQKGGEGGLSLAEDISKSMARRRNIRWSYTEFITGTAEHKVK